MREAEGSVTPAALDRSYAHAGFSADVGAMDVVFLDEADAIHNATGARIRDFPATPDKLLPALEALEH